jgi:hypothetical protein
VIRWLTRKLLAREYVRSAIRDRADLNALRERPAPRIVVGLVIIGLSYCIGWPAVGVLGILAVWWEMPLLAAVGAPLVYGLSHLTFILGFFLAGAKYTRIFMRWATRIGVERLLKLSGPETDAGAAKGSTGGDLAEEPPENR